jgi:hypothetical protein
MVKEVYRYAGFSIAPSAVDENTLKNADLLF